MFLTGSCPLPHWSHLKSLEATRLKAPAWVFTLEYRLAQISNPPTAKDLASVLKYLPQLFIHAFCFAAFR
jgi:hypothetical protein